jgi:hypothetical protein
MIFVFEIFYPRLEKIMKVDAQRLEGKVLNEEQLVLLSSRPAVERSLADIDALKSQLEDVAKERKVCIVWLLRNRNCNF